MDGSKVAFWRDSLFFGALGAGILFWLILFAVTRPAPDLTWPLHDPMRFIYPALLYPVLEELVFRGLLQDLAHRYLKPWRLGPLSHANILTSLVFTAMHFAAHPPLWAASVIFPSLVFGYFKDRSGALYAPILLHIFYNAGYFWIFAQ